MHACTESSQIFRPHSTLVPSCGNLNAAAWGPPRCDMQLCLLTAALPEDHQCQPLDYAAAIVFSCLGHCTMYLCGHVCYRQCHLVSKGTLTEYCWVSCVKMFYYCCFLGSKVRTSVGDSDRNAAAILMLMAHEG